MSQAVHSAAKQLLSNWENPIGTDGFEFLEFAAADIEPLMAQFSALGFTQVASHKDKNIRLFQQGDVRFLLNGETSGYSHQFTLDHGPCACAMAFRVKDAQHALNQLIALGAVAFNSHESTLQLPVPAILGVGGSVIYLIDTYETERPYLNDFIFDKTATTTGFGITYLDHVTHNVYRGHLDSGAAFYEKLFNFREIRYFDIEGKLTGLKSRAMTSPCGKIRIPVNESSDDKSQIEEYLREYKGEGIQHIAMGTATIYDTVKKMRDHAIAFLSVPDSYYQAVNQRIEDHGESVEALKELRILMDGAPTKGQGLLLQIFTQNMIGPIFFEIIQRKGNEGFGEGNFQALFEAMEQDQMERGVL